MWLVGRRWGVAVGLVATAAMAVMPGHVREAHFILTDTPLTAFIALTLLLSVRATERQRVSDVALAAAAVGLATAVKYNGVIALMMPMMAAVTLSPNRRLPALVAAPIVAGATFLLCAPYTVLDLPAFLNGVAYLVQSYNEERPLPDAMRIYLSYLRGWFTWPGVLPAAIGYLALGLAVIGSALLLRQDTLPRRIAALLAPAFAAVYFVFLSTQSLQYGRYLLPIGPMIALGLAAGLVSVATRMAGPARQPLTVALCAAVLLAPPAAASVSWNRAHGRTTTSELAAAWIVEHASATDRVAAEAPRFHLPPRFALMSSTPLAARGIDEYREAGVTLLVTNSDVASREEADATAAAIRRDLLSHTTPVATFAPDAAHPGIMVTIHRVRPAE